LRKEATLDALDVLGVGPDDPVDLIKDIYRKKSMYYHPDKGGTDEKFKRLKDAYELIMNNRGQKP
jgi:curved DNA-binding protein CbpA